MPFPPGPYHPISNEDVLSFTFGNPTGYDIHKPVLIDPAKPSIHLTYASARQLVRRLIAGLRGVGLKYGDTVCIHSFNSIYYPIIVLAIIGAGGTAIGTNPSYTTHELGHAVRTAHIKYVLAEPEILGNFQVALKENGMDVGERLFILDHDQQTGKLPAGMKSWRTLYEHGKEEDWIRFDDETRSRETVAELFFTSGTSGYVLPLRLFGLKIRPLRMLAFLEQFTLLLSKF